VSPKELTMPRPSARKIEARKAPRPDAIVRLSGDLIYQAQVVAAQREITIKALLNDILAGPLAEAYRESIRTLAQSNGEHR
jgi:hypothetical protein